ncbi:MAG: hypothetical protein ACI80M_000382, partial [Gammaproteobacteria bacterium]
HFLTFFIIGPNKDLNKINVRPSIGCEWQPST